MGWDDLATRLRLTETHIKAWQLALMDAQLILTHVPSDDRGKQLKKLIDTALTLIDELQSEHDRLCEMRSLKLAGVFHL